MKNTGGQHDGEGQVCGGRRLSQGFPRYKSQDRIEEQEGPKTLEEVPEDLLEVMTLGPGGSILAIFDDSALDLLFGEALFRGCRQATDSFVYRYGVPFEVGKILTMPRLALLEEGLWPGIIQRFRPVAAAF